MTATSERLLTALETEITNVSKLEHVLARTRVVLREHATRLRLGEDAEIVMTGLRFYVPAETGLAVHEPGREHRVRGRRGRRQLMAGRRRSRDEH